MTAQIKKAVAAGRPFASCDGCLALRLDVSLDEARLAALAVAREDGFVRKVIACHGCGRSLEMTSMSASSKLHE